MAKVAQVHNDSLENEMRCVSITDQIASSIEEKAASESIIQCQNGASVEGNNIYDNMLNRVASSNAFFKQQQIGDPDISHQEKCNIIADIFKNQPATFLARYGRFLHEDDISLFDDVTADYTIQFHLNHIKKHLDLKKSAVTVRNRRYEAMKKLREEGIYFR